jgi:hypothetical protein
VCNARHCAVTRQQHDTQRPRVAAGVHHSVSGRSMMVTCRGNWRLRSYRTSGYRGAPLLVEALDDRDVAWQQLPHHLHRPPLERLGHDRVVRERDAVRHDALRLVPVDACMRKVKIPPATSSIRPPARRSGERSPACRCQLQYACMATCSHTNRRTSAVAAKASGVQHCTSSRPASPLLSTT